MRIELVVSHQAGANAVAGTAFEGVADRAGRHGTERLGLAGIRLGLGRAEQATEEAAAVSTSAASGATTATTSGASAPSTSGAATATASGAPTATTTATAARGQGRGAQCESQRQGRDNKLVRT